MFAMQPGIMTHLTHLRIEEAVGTLRDAGALEVHAFELKLRQNAKNPTQVSNHLSEACVALMFIENGARVTMRDSPDLKVDWLGDTFYAEVKHFKRKKQDQLDEAAERNAPGDMLAPVGNTLKLEGRHPLEQLSDVMRRKRDQYMDGAVNILVVDSRSESMELMAQSAVNEFDDQVLKTPGDQALRKLNGIMLITSWSSTDGNVEFCRTQRPTVPMSPRLALALDNVRKG